MSIESMLKDLKEKGRPLSDFKKDDLIYVDNKMEKTVGKKSLYIIDESC